MITKCVRRLLNSHLRRFIHSPATIQAPDTRQHAISDAEFYAMLDACKPSAKWPTKIAVAFSGGPDSTSLLYLLKRLISLEEYNYSLPKELIAVTIDHGLQECSTRHAKLCEEFAASINVPHMTLRIPWSSPPFPKLGPEGRNFEEVARKARYHLLWTAMNQANAGVIAFGHHADDQVETALLRIARGSSEIGAGGMRPCRLWGMGLGDGPGTLGWAGYQGMQKWIIRPMLGVSKDRILETCRDRHLPYVEDPTNQQSNLTPRNAIRQSLKANPNSESGSIEASLKQELDTETAERYILSQDTIDVGTNLSRMERLRRGVAEISRRVNDIDSEVTRQLSICSLRSPISTFLLDSNAVSQVTDPSIRLAMVIRILRYISPRPWGSPSAEAGRRSSSLGQIVERVWGLDGNETSLVSGGGVVWSRVILDKNGGLKRRRPMLDRDRCGWLASRQPTKPNALDIDITAELLSTWHERKTVEILWDNRFLICVRPHRLSQRLVSSLIESPSSSSIYVEVDDHHYYLPRLVWRRGRNSSFTLAKFLKSGKVSYGPSEGFGGAITVTHSAFKMIWIRSMEADGPSRNQTVYIPTPRDLTPLPLDSW
ncbi:hypothetical protein BD410DRAFT_820155 [Rickenella mellea]|uniref:tRNA(Ile)-lysidine synthetase n=1 Tax=Rickenella mellea TaxID=50990 RepID=A0A4Y7QCJ9_9AGAM|nr:hypothetical protein BD410DRAFT_820155 [Rickenella mellea]